MPEADEAATNAMRRDELDARLEESQRQLTEKSDLVCRQADRVIRDVEKKLTLTPRNGTRRLR